MGILEITKASQGIIGETRSCSVNEVRALGTLNNLLEGPSIVVVGSGVREMWL